MQRLSRAAAGDRLTVGGIDDVPHAHPSRSERRSLLAAGHVPESNEATIRSVSGGSQPAGIRRKRERGDSASVPLERAAGFPSFYFPNVDVTVQSARGQ